MIGLTVRYPTMLGEPKTDGERILLNEYGSINNMLITFQVLGVKSVELSMLSVVKTPADNVLKIVKTLKAYGFHVTVHGLLEGVAGFEHFSHFACVYDYLLHEQSETVLTVHSMPTYAETVTCMESFAKEAQHRYPNELMIALENQRIHVHDGSQDHLRINNLPHSLPNYSNVGICWDFGHYGFNQIKENLREEGLPAPGILDRVIHTHVHSIRELDTHYPLLVHASKEYISALKAAGYTGVFNLELVTEKFYAHDGARAGMESSIKTLQSIIENYHCTYN